MELQTLHTASAIYWSYHPQLQVENALCYIIYSHTVNFNTVYLTVKSLHSFEIGICSDFGASASPCPGSSCAEQTENDNQLEAIRGDCSKDSVHHSFIFSMTP